MPADRVLLAGLLGEAIGGLPEPLALAARALLALLGRPELVLDQGLLLERAGRRTHPLTARGSGVHDPGSGRDVVRAEAEDYCDAIANCC